MKLFITFFFNFKKIKPQLSYSHHTVTAAPKQGLSHSIFAFHLPALLVFAPVVVKLIDELTYFLVQMGGSVDEESTKSDEEYDDLAMLDGLEDGGYSSPDDEQPEANCKRLTNGVLPEINSVKAIDFMELIQKYQQSLDLFFENTENLNQSWDFHFDSDRNQSLDLF